MSSPESESFLKAGFVSAKRIGKMRVKNHKRQTSKEAHTKGSESDDGPEELIMAPPKPQAVVTFLNKNDVADHFSPEAIQSYHEKPSQSRECRLKPRANIIQQPKKC